jgi:hypothetical protein
MTSQVSISNGARFWLIAINGVLFAKLQMSKQNEQKERKKIHTVRPAG